MEYALANLVQLAAPVAACGVACVGLAAYGTFAPASTFWGPVISRSGAGERPRVALTFDDGPTPGSTERVLDALGELGVRAAFFVVGRNVEKSPEILRRIDREGHVVGNHTWDHSHYGVFGRGGYWREQVRLTDREIERVLGRRPAMFRPPMGIKTWHVTQEARLSGHAVVTWSRGARDGVATEAGRIIERLVPASRPGDILLLHDGLEPNAPRRDTRATEQAIRPLVRGLRARGLEPVRLDELLGAPAYQPTAIV